jgi:hypothetical protein
VLLVVDCVLFDTSFCGKRCCCVYIGTILFLIISQEQIHTVTVEGVQNVVDEDWIEIKTEDDYIQLVGRVKCEQEVSVLFWCVLCW